MTEREVQRDPEVLEGEDEFPHQPASPLDPYTPEPGPGRGEAMAFAVLRIAVIALAVALPIVIVVALLAN